MCCVLFSSSKHLVTASSLLFLLWIMATTSIEVSTQPSSPQLSWSMPNSNGRSSTLHLHENDSRRTIQSPSPTARNSRASSLYNELCDKVSFASHPKKIAAKPFHLYTKYSQSLLLENTASVARDHLGRWRDQNTWVLAWMGELRARAAPNICCAIVCVYKELIYNTANERTFLAWLRTSISLITVGVGKCQQQAGALAPCLISVIFSHYTTL